MEFEVECRKYRKTVLANGIEHAAQIFLNEIIGESQLKLSSVMHIKCIQPEAYVDTNSALAKLSKPQMLVVNS